MCAARSSTVLAEGTLVVESMTPGSASRSTGRISHHGAGGQGNPPEARRYTIERARTARSESELVAVTNNGRQVVRVSQEPATVPKAAAEKKDTDRRAAEYVLSIGETFPSTARPRGPSSRRAAQGAFRLTSSSHHNKKVNGRRPWLLSRLHQREALGLYACNS